MTPPPNNGAADIVPIHARDFGKKPGSAAKGAAAELLVAARLLHYGFDVYRNVSSTGKGDLIARDRNLRIAVVEVTCGRRGPKGGLRYQKHVSSRGVWEIMAVVNGTELVFLYSNGQPVSEPKMLMGEWPNDE